jgi:short-subunit dehydrogenase
MLDRFRSQWAVVTGGGDGIGRALCLALADCGLNIAVQDIREEAAKTVADQTAAMGVQTRTIVCDVADTAALKDAASEFVNVAGAPALLCANAGVAVGAGLLTAKPHHIDWIFGVNILGLLQTLRTFVPLMQKGTAPAKHVCITASSISLATPEGPFTIYGATKHAAMGIGEALRGELAGSDVGVTILCPGLTDTNIWNAGQARPERLGGAAIRPHAEGERWRNQGLDPAWIAAETIKAIDANRAYVAPVHRSSAAAFERRVESIRAGFVLHDDPT